MRFNNLQILRLFAASGVVLYHLGVYAQRNFGVLDGPVPWLLMPWLSPVFVPLFFALSGFVLTHALESTTPGRYLALRAIRLYPGFWLAVVLLLIVYRLGLWPGSNLDLPNPTPNRRTVWLLPTSRVSRGQYPLMIEWSLIYEVFLSASLLLVWMVTGPKRLRIAVGGWLAVLAAKSILWPGYGTETLPVWKSIWASTHLVPFLLGVLGYGWRSGGRRWRRAAPVVALGLTILAGAWPMQANPDWHCWLRGCAAALTVWFLASIRDASTHNPFVVFGGYSYGLYLTHVPLMLLSMWAMHVTGLGPGTWQGVGAAGLLALSLGLAYGRFEGWMYGHARKLAGPGSLARIRRAAHRARRAMTRTKR